MAASSLLRCCAAAGVKINSTSTCSAAKRKRRLWRFHHPNIVEILAIRSACEKNTGQYYIVMEFVEDGNLRARCSDPARSSILPLDAMKIIEDAANGLAYAHSMRGLHAPRHEVDEHPRFRLGTAKLVDFGLAKMFQAMTGSTEDKVDRTVDYAGLSVRRTWKSAMCAATFISWAAWCMNC